MPTRFIHSRSLVIPSFVTFPAVQCHHVRGFAESGGFTKPSDNSSPPADDNVIATTTAADSARMIRIIDLLRSAEVPTVRRALYHSIQAASGALQVAGARILWPREYYGCGVRCRPIRSRRE